MKIDKILKKLAKNCTWSLKIRPNLHTIHFEWNKAVATDSFKLIEVEYLDEVFDTKNICATDIINNSVDINLLDNKECVFPAYDTFFLKETDKTIKVKFSVDYMIKMLEVYKSWNVRDVLISFNNPLTPIDMYWIDEECKVKIRWILMPLKQ